MPSVILLFLLIIVSTRSLGMELGASEIEKTHLKVSISTENVQGTDISNKVISLKIFFRPTHSSTAKISNSKIEVSSFKTRMLSHGHGMVVTPKIRKLSHNSFLVEGVKFHMEGSWEIDLTLLIDDKLRTALIPLEIGAKSIDLTSKNHIDWKSVISSFIATAPKKLSDKEKKFASFGKKLFFDKSLSHDGNLSCSSCHVPEHFFTEPNQTPLARKDISRNTPTVVNTFASSWLFWDGRADSLEAQAIEPFISPKEHGLTYESLAGLVTSRYQNEYEELFGDVPKSIKVDLASRAKEAHIQLNDKILERIFSTIPADVHQEISWEARRTKASSTKLFASRYLSPVVNLNSSESHNRNLGTSFNVVRNVAKAIAAYERSLIAIDSPFDQFARNFVDGDKTNHADSFVPGFGEKELQGLDVFLNEGKCLRCHSGPHFTDQQFHNIGLPDSSKSPDLGRITGIALVNESHLNCRNGFFKVSKSNSCKELPWLDKLSMQAIGAFKTPSLRNVAMTAPYGHNGSLASLSDVIANYRNSNTRSFVGHREATLRGIKLTDEQAESLELFLRSLTSKIMEMNL